MYEYSIMELFNQIMHRMWENITFWKQKKLDHGTLPSFLRTRPIPKSTGNTIKWRRYERLPTECKPLVEGVTPSKTDPYSSLSYLPWGLSDIGNTLNDKDTQ